MTEPSSLPFELPKQEDIKVASAAVSRKSTFGYGKQGILASDGERLFFLSEPGWSWAIPLASIAQVKRPWYGVGTYLTFKAEGQPYRLAFTIGPTEAAHAGSAAQTLGGPQLAASLQAASVVGDMQGAALAKQWENYIAQAQAAAS